MFVVSRAGGLAQTSCPDLPDPNGFLLAGPADLDMRLGDLAAAGIIPGA